MPDSVPIGKSTTNEFYLDIQDYISQYLRIYDDYLLITESNVVYIGKSTNLHNRDNTELVLANNELSDQLIQSAKIYYESKLTEIKDILSEKYHFDIKDYIENRTKYTRDKVQVIEYVTPDVAIEGE